MNTFPWNLQSVRVSISEARQIINAIGCWKRREFLPESGREPVNWTIRSEKSLEKSGKETVQLEY